MNPSDGTSSLRPSSSKARSIEATGLAIAGLCIVALRLAVKAQVAPVATGVEGLNGETGTVENIKAQPGLWSTLFLKQNDLSGRKVMPFQAATCVGKVRG